MKINKIELKNFKFHQNLEFEIDNNCLIYGENGTGKSSIYEALYSIFKIYFRNKQFSFNKFKNNSSIDELSIKVTFDNTDKLIIPNENYNLPNNIEAKNKKTIYFANQDLLESIFSNENFYIFIENKLSKYFNNLNDLYQKQEEIQNREQFQELELFLEKVSKKTNQIIKNSFEEEFKINFQYFFQDRDLENNRYIKPIIKLQIDNQDNLKQNFNEAKLKLASIAIFFALIKLEEDESNPIKLLVLDDFLTSLDMANRHYIIEYILNEFDDYQKIILKFDDYQKIILTHNLQFYNLILNLLKTRDEINNWDNKNIFLNIDKEAIIYNKETDYINLAKQYLNSNSLDEAGIYLRKEFERLVEELRIINEIGAKEKLSSIINQLIKLDNTQDINIKKMQEVLKKTKFYQDTTLHSTAHDDMTTDKYTKELNGTIIILNLLNKQINILKKDKN